MKQLIRFFKGYGEIITCRNCKFVFKSEELGNICPNCNYRNG